MQGFNMGRYYPPDAVNPPAFNTTSHPLGARANKISQGILIVRFELPFAVWCQHCKPAAIVGQGVRFNAEKKKVGNYYSTPIWSFRMKHSACGGWWEIRTDPKNAAYVVCEGAVKRDYGPEDAGGEGGIGDMKFLSEEEREKRRSDAFVSLEGKVAEKGEERKNKERVEELYEKSEVWRDPYDVNARLRRGFREKRREWKKEDRHKEGMQDKFSLGIDIVDETDTDRMRARIVEFGGPIADEEAWKPLFEGKKEEKAVEPIPKTKKLKAEVKAEKSRQSLQQTLVGNTKATLDPFLVNANGTKTKPTFSVLKRKRDAQAGSDNAPATIDTAPTPNIAISTTTAQQKPELATALVGYDSD